MGGWFDQRRQKLGVGPHQTEDVSPGKSDVATQLDLKQQGRKGKKMWREDPNEGGEKKIIITQNREKTGVKAFRLVHKKPRGGGRGKQQEKRFAQPCEMEILKEKGGDGGPQKTEKVGIHEVQFHGK